MKRLPFALVALSLSIPVVACLNSSSDEAGSSEDNLNQADRADCNFAFTAATAPASEAITFGPKGTNELAQGKRVVFADINGDGKLDFVAPSALNKVQAWLGKGDGTFTKGVEKTVSGGYDASRKRVAVETVAVGDFDKDGKQDIVVATTTIPKGDAPDATDVQIEHRVLFGDGSGELKVWNQKTFPAVKDKVNTNLVGDLNGDEVDDLVVATQAGELVMFGQAGNRDLKLGATDYPNTAARRFAVIAPKTDKASAALLIATETTIASISFDKDTLKAAAPTETSWGSFVTGATRVGGDFDGNGKSEIALQAQTSGLSITTVGAKTLTFDGMTGNLIAALDLDKNSKTELLYAPDDTHLAAACGYSPATKALGVAPLAIPYDFQTFVAGTPDLNGDGKPDVVTLPKDGGELKVFIGGGRLETAPELVVFNSNLAPSTDSDAGSDATVVTEGDATVVTEGDASTGTDAGPDPTTDAGPTTTDAGPGPTPDAGPKADAGPPPPKKDAGASKPDNAGDDDDDDSTAAPEPPNDEGSGTKTKKPTTKPSTGTTTGSVTITQKPQAVDDGGCSAAPGSHGMTTSAFGGIFAAMMLLGRRARRRKNG